MERNKWLSRKFWMACATIIITIIAGFGYELDPEFVVMMVGAEGMLWIVIEGLIDCVKK